jgi:hypothetical protein
MVCTADLHLHALFTTAYIYTADKQSSTGATQQTEYTSIQGLDNRYTVHKDHGYTSRQQTYIYPHGLRNRHIYGLHCRYISTRPTYIHMNGLHNRTDQKILNSKRKIREKEEYRKV